MSLFATNRAPGIHAADFTISTATTYRLTVAAFNAVGAGAATVRTRLAGRPQRHGLLLLFSRVLNDLFAIAWARKCA